jgi:hypothetical protein
MCRRSDEALRATARLATPRSPSSLDTEAPTSRILNYMLTHQLNHPFDPTFGSRRLCIGRYLSECSNDQGIGVNLAPGFSKLKYLAMASFCHSVVTFLQHDGLSISQYTRLPGLDFLSRRRTKQATLS